MEANEAPEKIYITNFDIEALPKNEQLSEHWHEVSTQDTDIEYIRADVLDDIITKSAVWFANRYQANGSYLCATDVEDYRKEIKEYIKQKWL